MFLDARIVVFAALALLHFRVWTLALLACVAAVLFLLERRGINPRSVPLFIRSWLLGPEIPARPPGEERYSVDYGFEMRDPAIRRELAQAEARSAPERICRHRPTANWSRRHLLRCQCSETGNPNCPAFAVERKSERMNRKERGRGQKNARFSARCPSRAAVIKILIGPFRIRID